LLLSNLHTFVNKGKVLAPNEVNSGNVIDLIPFRLGFVAFDAYHIGSARVLHVCGGVAEMCITIRGGSRGVQIEHDIEHVNFIFNVSPSCIYLLSSTCMEYLPGLLINFFPAMAKLSMGVLAIFIDPLPRLACEDILRPPLSPLPRRQISSL
jgi:hypothetical protein